MKKATAKSPANIAFIKYWGKTDPRNRVPENNSISMCLSDFFSICTVAFDSSFSKDVVKFIGERVVKKREVERVIKVIDRVRALAGINLRANVVTKNNFPKATGIASSASGFSAVTLAGASALGIEVSDDGLSKLSRLASGTAGRSIPDGFVEWEKGSSHEDSFAKQIFPPDWWEICDVVAIVTHKMKKVSSSDGHRLASTSPFYKARIKGMDRKIKAIKKSMRDRDFSTFGETLEAEALNMHAICMTSKPPIIYWEAPTIEIMRQVQEWREKGKLESYFTIDAGPTVHVICQKRNSRRLAGWLKKIEGIERVSVNHPSIGARVIDEHLF
jgi:diphosphomevalonate decarboxylase